MRHSAGIILTALLVLVCGTSAAAGSRLAPADEYFGRMGMSPLEITNRIRDAEIRGAAATYHVLLATQAALEDWAAKYPLDPWIAPRELRLYRLFAHMGSQDGNAAAAHCRVFLRRHFPKLRY